MANVLHLDEPFDSVMLTPATESSDWRRALPVLTGGAVTLRGLRDSDAPALLRCIDAEDVRRFVAAPPDTVDEFGRFIAWTKRQQEAGQHVSFAVTLPGDDTAVGLIQIRDLARGFESAEWGFAIDSELWGSGIFADAAQLVLRFAFETLKVHRLEARAIARNGRAIAALRKLGAVEEGVLRQSFKLKGRYVDQVLCSILRDDWMAARVAARRDSLVSIH